MTHGPRDPRHVEARLETGRRPIECLAWGIFLGKYHENSVFPKLIGFRSLVLTRLKIWSFQTIWIDIKCQKWGLNRGKMGIWTRKRGMIFPSIGISELSAAKHGVETRKIRLSVTISRVVIDWEIVMVTNPNLRDGNALQLGEILN